MSFKRNMLYCLILPYKKADKAIRVGKSYGLKGATIFYGKGTVRNQFLNFLGIYDDLREIVLIGTSEEEGDIILSAISKDLQMYKPGKGIAFSIPLSTIIGSQFYQENNLSEQEDKEMEYKLIVTIVEKGNADKVIDAAQKAGSQGGTIINARGAGVHETKKIFNIEIEPEKEIVFIIAKTESVENIVSEIRLDLKIDEPGKGIIFVTEVAKTIGLFENKTP